MPDCTPHAPEIVMVDTPRRIAPAPKRAKRRPTSTLPPLPGVILEHGLEHRYAQGGVEVERGIADPDMPNRTINRARATSAHRLMWKRGALTAEHSAAADRYGELVETQEGARWDNGENVASASDSRPWDKDGATQAQLAAVVALRVIHAVLGNAGRAMVWFVAVDNMTAEMIAVRVGRHRQGVTGEVRAALTRLVEHFEEVDARPAKRRHTIRA